jgi:hypothetical protein
MSISRAKGLNKISRYAALSVNSVSHMDSKLFEMTTANFNLEDNLEFKFVWKQSCVKSTGILLH